MLIQNSKNQFVCKNDNYKTTDIFDYLDHSEVEFVWGIKLSKKVSLDMFHFLSLLNDSIVQGNLDEAYDTVQSAALLLVNASSDEVDEFIEEAIVRGTTGEMIRSIEEMLKNE